MSSLLSRARILAAVDLKIVDEPVPEWPNEDGSPGIIRLRQMSAKESMDMTKEMEGEQGKNGMFIILIRSAVDENGAPLFTMADVDDLKEKNIRVLNRLQRVCLRLNSMLDSEVALKKDSSEADTAASPTS